MVSNLRAPNSRVLVNGTLLSGVIDFEVCSTSHLSADRFRLRLALAACGSAIWSLSSIEVGIDVEVGGFARSLIVGDVDRVEIDVVLGEVIVDGRDLSSRLLVGRTQETFENRTASEIAELLAARHGLSATVTPTTSRVGRNFQNGCARLTLDQYSRASTEWDLLTDLAEGEGFDVWVAGTSLNFCPPLSGQSPVLVSPEDCVHLRLQRSLSLDSQLGVIVRSWDSRGQTSVSQSAYSPGASEVSPSYVLLRPNLAADAAQSLADHVLEQMTQHGRTISIEMPGELQLDPRCAIQVLQTGTDFDGLYVISEIERRFSFRHGFSQVVQARRPSWTNSSTS